MNEEQRSKTLVNGIFTPLSDKLKVVGKYPCVTKARLEQAVRTAKKSGLIKRFEEASRDNHLLDIVVSVYQADAPSTLAYARDRIHEAFHDSFCQDRETYDCNIDNKRVRLLRRVPKCDDQIRIEVVDLGANWVQGEKINSIAVRCSKSAHAAVLFAAAQSPEWVKQMNGGKVPSVLIGGYELKIPRFKLWVSIPLVCFEDGSAQLEIRHSDFFYYNCAVPVVWQ